MIFDANGAVPLTFEEILAQVTADFQDEWPDIETELSSSAGQLMRIMALWEARMQEMALAVYTQTDPRLSEGVHLDRSVAGGGAVRRPDTPAEVLGYFNGTPGTVIPDGTRVSVHGKVFLSAEGPYTITAGGITPLARVIAELPGPVTPSEPWVLVDLILGLDGFYDEEQPVIGFLRETDLEFRASAEVSSFRRGQGPLAAIEAAVLAVVGVTYARAWHNVTVDPVDADGIELHGIKVVVEGGEASQVAQAIWDSMPAGHKLFGTDESEIVVDGPSQQTIVFDRVADVILWARVTLTTSTSEEVPPDGLAGLVKDLVAEYTLGHWLIGTDALPHRIVGVVSGLSGVDGVVVEFSTDNGVGDPYSSAKRSISITERANLTTARVLVVED